MPPRDPAPEEALRLLDAARKNGEKKLDLSDFKLSTLPEAISGSQDARDDRVLGSNGFR